ncbi:MFS transporter [Paenibacillus rhizovicinus]|uniref:MFS transporter n=1 Tax=Paenibacillus rhizovicinus TaxID=2704463 RepID=A0A6C0P0S8_9BACL|nr:MFS transporter [Paenibacillus rhizovicinus]QHW32085.1 MFS transporter [Paenibacillus rhizovicinus]
MPAVKLSPRQSFIFSSLCCLVYFTSYMTRLNYGAAISEIADSLRVSNSLAGMALIGSFIAYGIGQPIFGLIGDRLPPRHMIASGLVATALLNLAVANTGNIYLITVIWCFNGLFQAMLWPPLVRIMTQTLSREAYNNASVGVVAAASAGTIGVYLLVPLCIVLSGWRMSFAIPAGLSLLVAGIWFAGARKFPSQSSGGAMNPVTEQASGKAVPLIFASGLLPIIAAIVLQGALRDGITTWMPTFIDDNFGLGNSFSILSTAVLPAFTIISVSAASFVQRILQNEVRTATLFWAAALVTAGLLIALYNANAIIGIALMACLTGCMHGINLMLISLLPVHFAKFGKVATISGILNAFTYLGSAGSIYGIAAMSGRFGWEITIVVWCAMALAGVILCAFCTKRWHRFIAKAGQEA